MHFISIFDYVISWYSRVGTILCLASNVISCNSHHIALEKKKKKKPFKWINGWAGEMQGKIERKKTEKKHRCHVFNYQQRTKWLVMFKIEFCGAQRQ